MAKISHLQYMKDKKILFQEFKNNPTIGVRDLSEKYGFSKQKIYKIKREFNAEFKKRKHSLPFLEDNSRHFILFFKSSGEFINTMNELDYEAIQHDLEHIQVDIDFCYMTNGHSDCVMGISTKKVSDLKIFCNTLKRDFKDQLLKIEIIEILQPVSFMKTNFICTNSEYSTASI